MTKARFVILLALAMGMILLLTPVGQAQTFRGRIQGIVTDESKAVVINATVTALNVNTGIKVVRQTSDTGLFVFDNVEPGTYSITVENTGFNKFLQENVLVQSGGDVTVNATLKPGSVQTTVTVNEAPPAVEFNSSNRESTLDQKMAEETPRLDRNSFKLGLLVPSAVNTRGENQPYNSWGPNSVDLGGGTNLQNELEVDGSPIGLGHKASVVPNVDAVQEIVVSTNSTNAESGHSAGGAILVTTKSGTNDWHGSGFYIGRYPWASAESDRTTFSANAERRNMYGGTLGNPIIKNKLFNFFSIEYWKITDPNVWIETLPTTLEKQGDFSQSHYLSNGVSGIRTIYDPYTTVTNPGTGAISVTPFANNLVPTARFDPLTASLVSQFWAPNNPGIDITGANNFDKGYTETFNYYDYSDRADYNISDKWKVFGRVSRYHTTDSSGNPTGTNTEFYVPTGTLRTGWQASGDAIWTINPRTVMTFHGDWRNVIDAYVSTPLASGSWASIWPNNPWYASYQNPQTNNQPVYFPALYVNGNLFGGHGFYWNQRPAGQAYNAKISHQVGSHFLKAGFEMRASYGLEYVNSAPGFNFNTALTANTYTNPNTNVYGDAYATYLLGALDGSSVMYGGPAPDPHTEFYGFYFQDDWKLSRRITLNLGIRDDYETAWHDPPHELSTGLDLSVANPAIAANPPVMPSAVTSILPNGGSGFYSWNGQWNFTSSSHPGMWNPQKLALQPRAGLAYKIDDKTALRFGYALYIIPTEFEFSPAPPGSGAEDLVFLEPPFYGMSGNQTTLSPLQGIPQETFSNPYPANNPLLPILGRNSGPQLGVGGSSLVWYPQNLEKPYNNRFNVTFQHELPGQIVVTGTYFLNLGDRSYTKELNGVNPQLLLNNETTINNIVANPFYHYLTPTLNPGPLYNQPQVSVWSLLSKYPQYGPLFEVGACCAAEKYNSVELKAQKMFSKGYNFLLSYVYINEKAETNGFNDETYYNNEMIWEPSNQPRHRITGAGTYEFPFGKGRTYLNTMNKVGEAVIGGWQLTGVASFVSGDYLGFGNMVWSGQSPCIGNPTPGHWFNTSVFQPISSTTPYVLRTNPLQFDCLTGPKYFDIDGSLAKTFRVTEKVKVELKMTAYNAINRLNRGDPDTGVGDSTFGKTLYQGAPGGSFGPSGQGGSNYASGRQVEFQLKVKF